MKRFFILSILLICLIIVSGCISKITPDNTVNINTTNSDEVSEIMPKKPVNINTTNSDEVSEVISFMNKMEEYLKTFFGMMIIKYMKLFLTQTNLKF